MTKPNSRSDRGDRKMPHAAVLDRSLLLHAYRAAASSSSALISRLFLFDYDGTLTPIVRDPNDALPSERLQRGLKALAADERNAVWVISGRDQDFLYRQLGHIPGLGFSAEHGSFMREPGSQSWVNMAAMSDMRWQGKALEILQRYTDSLSGTHVEQKHSAITWHYRRAEQESGIEAAGRLKAELERTVAKDHEVDVIEGKCCVEVRPSCINKGNIVKLLVSRHNLENDKALKFVFCVGDDNTDEDMFRALNSLISSQLVAENVFTITVGPSEKSTHAHWHVLEPEDVIQSILLLAVDGSLPDSQLQDSVVAASDTA